VCQTVLMITGIAGAEECAASLSRMLGLTVETASSRRDGLAALRRTEYDVVLVDESIAEGDPAAADLMWKQAGMAIPLEVNFAIAGVSRIARQLKAALLRREHEQLLAMRAAASTIEGELRSTVAGLLLQSQLALAEPAVPPQVASKLQMVADLAGTLRQRLERPLVS
jgi:hypothetical protein